MNYSKMYGLQTGDQIITPLFASGLSKHFAVYLGYDENGNEWIAENHKLNGVQIISAFTYFNQIKIVDRIEKFRGSMVQRRALISKAKRLIGTPYNLVNYNCEHFATDITTGRAESRQIEITLYSLFGILFLNLLKE